jgi:hypothetical protein
LILPMVYHSMIDDITNDLTNVLPFYQWCFKWLIGLPSCHHVLVTNDVFGFPMVFPYWFYQLMVYQSS